MTRAYEWLAEASLWWWPKFADHLWQTTLFALVVLAASFTLRRGPAGLRHTFWLLASAKFIIPAALFVFFAQQAGIDSLDFFRSAPHTRQNALVASGVTQPVSALAFNYEVDVVAAAPNDHNEIYLAVTLVWLAGCVTLPSVWGVRRRRFLRSLKLGHHIMTGREWEILERARQTLGFNQNVGLVISPLQIEPAVWRVWRPVVVMPESIANQLDDDELATIMLHELVHIQRRDNLIGNLQLALCALLWFHPLVWFISRKLFDEREQACDERVLEVCGAPETYAASILKVVRFCFGSRLAGVAGAASGTNLRRRIENIMTLGNTKRRSGAASRLLAGGMVTLALIVLVGAGVYSKASALNAAKNGNPFDILELRPVNEDGDVSSIVPTEPASSTQRRVRQVPPPPPPQPAQPLQPDQLPQPAEAPQPAQGPDPAQPPQPAQAPKPAQAPPPPPPTPVGAGVGRGVATGVGRGSAPSVGSGIATGVGGGIGVGSARSVAPAPPSSRSIPAAPARPASVPATPTPPPPPAKKSPRDQKGSGKNERGALIEAPPPVYPEDAKQKKIEGVVAVHITIGEDGNVMTAKAQSGPEALHGAAQEAATQARFKPTMKDGKAVQVVATMSYNFVLAKK